MYHILNNIFTSEKKIHSTFHICKPVDIIKCVIFLMHYQMYITLHQERILCAPFNACNYYF